MKPPRAWYRVENTVADPTVAEIHIIDYIGSWDDDWFARNYGLDMGITARQFVEDLAALPASVATIRVFINSLGGDVMGGINITNALRDQQISKGRVVETIVVGIAGSIASVIAMAGGTVTMADNALMVIHDPISDIQGTARDLRAGAIALDTIRAQIVNTYRWHSPLDDAAIIALLEAETWMSADEAIANGFATAKQVGLKAAAALDGRVLATMKVPAHLKDRVAAFIKPALTTDPPAPTAASAVDVVRECRAADCLDLLDGLLAANATLEDVRAKVTEAKTAKAAATARATEITALCATAKVPELAADYIAGGMPIDKVRAQLTTITAKFDQVEIDGKLPVDPGVKKSVVNSLEIFASRQPAAKS